MKKDHREINPDGLEMFISILERLDFTYFRSILCLDMPIMTCPSGGGSKPLHPFAFILVTIIHAINIREYSTSMSDNFPHAHFLLMILPVLPNCSNGETLS